MTAPADVRIAPQRAQAGAGRIDDHAVEYRPEGKRREQIRLDDAHVGCTGRGDRLPEKVHPAIADIAGDQHVVVSKARRDRRGLATGGRTGIEHSRAGPLAGKERDEL